MANSERSRVRYSYHNPKLTGAALKHAFKYLSVITGIRFLENDDCPDLFACTNIGIPQSARLTVKANGEGGSCTFIRNGDGQDEWRRFLAYDPIEAIAEKLSFSGRLGPNRDKLSAHSHFGDITLSGAVQDFLSALSSAGVIVGRNQPIAIWPEDARFAVAVSHDIDIARRRIPGSLRLLFKRDLPGGFGGLADSLLSALGLRYNPYDAIPEWIKMENELGIKSTFFIFAGNRRHPLDPVYSLKTLSAGINALKKNGFEIALHTSIACHSGDGIPESLSALSEYAAARIQGLRPHYLSVFFPEYWKAAGQSGIAYSSALGFDDRIGFYDGIDLPFIPFDKTGDSSIDLVEIPIGIMDCGLIGDNPATSDEVIRRGIELIDKTAQTGGLLALDWHQRTFYNRDYPGWAQLFLRLVRYAKDKGAYFDKMSNLASLLMNRFREEA
jgi:peptidoglycan/xylan/chitin deacetylase (PgdA/CDA1 family)